MWNKVLVRDLFKVFPILLVVMLGNAEAEDSDGRDLIIIGTQKTLPYRAFTGIPMNMRPFLESVHLELVEFEPDYLVAQLEGCTNLKALILRDTYWKLKHFTRKVHLPNLDLLELNLRNWDYAYSSVDEMLSLYFAYKTPQGKYNNSASVASNEFTPSLDFTSKISILTSIGEMDILTYSFGFELVKIVSLPFDVSPYFKFRELDLQHTILNVTSLKKIDKGLRLQNVKIVGGGTAEIFAKSTEATNLQCDFSEMVTIDMAQLSTNLIQFGISNGNMWTSLPHVNISTLQTLRLTNSILNVTNLPNFETLRGLTLTETTIWDGDMLFITKMAPLEVLVLDSMANFDITILKASSKTLNWLQLRNMEVAQSSRCIFEQDLELTLYNSILDSIALTLFKETFQHMKTIRIDGTSFEYVAELLIESLKTSVKLIDINLRGDQRIRQKPEFKEVNDFLNGLDVPPYSTSLLLVKSPLEFPTETSYFGWKYEGYAEDFTQNPNLRDLTMYCYVIPLFLICFIGITGNIISGFVLSTKEMRSSTSCVLLGLTFCDTTILTTYILSVLYFGLKFAFMFWKFAIPEDEFPVFWFDISLQSAQESEKLQSLFLYPLNKTAYTGSVYMTVLVTLERYVAVCWPLRCKSILTTKKAIFCTLSILVFSILLNIPRWIEAQANMVSEIESSYEPVHWELYRETSAKDLLMYTAYREFYHGWIWVTLMYIIPISLLIGLNLKIWIQLKRRIANKDGLTGSRNSRNEEELASLTKLLICVATIFIICNIINGVVSLAILWYNPGDWEPADIEIFSCIPLIINSSVNFILYCLMGKKFRGIIIKMLQIYCINNWSPIIPCSWCNQNHNVATVSCTLEVTQDNTELSRM